MGKKKKQLKSKRSKGKSKTALSASNNKINSLFVKAGKFQQAGQPAEAESIYRQILQDVTRNRLFISAILVLF